MPADRTMSMVSLAVVFGVWEMARYLNRHEARFVVVVFHFFLVKFLGPVVEPVEGESVVFRKIGHRQTAFVPSRNDDLSVLGPPSPLSYG